MITPLPCLLPLLLSIPSLIWCAPASLTPPPQWHLKEVEVIDTKNGVSYLFVCGQWLSRDAAEHNTGLDGSSFSENAVVQLERVDVSETDVRVCMCLHHARIQSAREVLYRLHFLSYI